MSVKAKRGVLVVGHGSRRREANDDVREAARRIAESGEPCDATCGRLSKLAHE